MTYENKIFLSLKKHTETNIINNYRILTLKLYISKKTDEENRKSKKLKF